MRLLALLLALPAFPVTASADPCLTLSTQSVTLVHVTDLHAHYNPGPDGVSPYARLRGYFNSVLKQEPGALFLDGGDDHEKGSLADIRSSGAATNEIVRAMRFDARVIGNHDFGWGEAAARDYLRDPYGPVLGGNLVSLSTAGPSPAYFYVRTVGCVRVGFFGFVPMPWNELNETYPGDYPGFRADHDYAGAARRLLAAVKGQADVVVMLSHLGADDDLAVASKVPGIDLVLGGHTHGWTWSPKTAGGAAVTETGPYAGFVSRADIFYNLKARKVGWIKYDQRRVDASMKPDAGVQAAVEGQLKRRAPDAGLRVSCAAREADAPGAAAAAAAAVLRLGAADAAVADANDVWEPWKAGPLAAQDFVDAFAVERQPAGTHGFSSFYTATVSGADLAAIAARADGKRWVYAGPKTPEKGRRYTLALPRHLASRPSDLVPCGFAVREPAFLMEAWEAPYRAALAAGPDACLDGELASLPGRQGRREE